MNDNFPMNFDMDRDSMYKSKTFKVDEEGEITADQPIQVRINGGPWVDVRKIDLNTDTYTR